VCAAEKLVLRRRNDNLGSYLAAPNGDPTIQILYPFAGSVQQYLEQLDDLESPRPRHCPQCRAQHPLTAHGCYVRAIIDAAFGGTIRVRPYLCEACRRTVSLLPEFALPFLRSSLAVIAGWLAVHLLPAAPTPTPTSPPMPYQRGQFWLRRFRQQAEVLCATLATLTAPAPAPNFIHRARARHAHHGRLDRRPSLSLR